MGIPEEKKKGAESIFEGIMTETFPNLIKNTNLYIKRAQ